MADAPDLRLEGRGFLVVEDEFTVGLSLCRELECAGAVIVGFCADVETSLAAIASAPVIDVAIVDLNLDGVKSAPVVDALLDRGVPVILSTGYETGSMEERFKSLPRCEKPFTRAALFRRLKSLPAFRPAT